MSEEIIRFTSILPIVAVNYIIRFACERNNAKSVNVEVAPSLSKVEAKSAVTTFRSVRGFNLAVVEQTYSSLPAVSCGESRNDGKVMVVMVVENVLRLHVVVENIGCSRKRETLIGIVSHQIEIDNVVLSVVVECAVRYVAIYTLDSYDIADIYVARSSIEEQRLRVPAVACQIVEAHFVSLHVVKVWISIHWHSWFVGSIFRTNLHARRT